MKGDIVNLRTARKRKARAAREAEAERNRTLFGRSKAGKSLDRAMVERARSHLDGHKLERDE